MLKTQLCSLPCTQAWTIKPNVTPWITRPWCYHHSVPIFNIFSHPKTFHDLPSTPPSHIIRPIQSWSSFICSFHTFIDNGLSKGSRPTCRMPNHSNFCVMAISRNGSYGPASVVISFATEVLVWWSCKDLLVHAVWLSVSIDEIASTRIKLQFWCKGTCFFLGRGATCALYGRIAMHCIVQG